VPTKTPVRVGHRRFASVKDAAEAYDVNPRTVRRWICDGRITGYRMGGKLVKVDLDEIEANVVKVIPAAQASA
jgi:excisionase family DNA binding protein